jgi:hypothetical protein
VLEGLHGGTEWGKSNNWNAIKYARAYADARMLVGTIGNVSSEVAATTVGEMSAHQRVRVMGGEVEEV